MLDSSNQLKSIFTALGTGYFGLIRCRFSSRSMLFDELISGEPRGDKQIRNIKILKAGAVSIRY